MFPVPLHPLGPRLASVETRSRDLPWAGDRPWSVRTHLGESNGLPLIDLHDLSVALALAVVDVCVEHPPSEGGVVLITGRGKHTGGRSKLRDAVQGRLSPLQEDGDLRFSPVGPGRFEVVFDPEAVRKARPGLGVLFWLFVALLALGIAAAIYNRL